MKKLNYRKAVLASLMVAAVGLGACDDSPTEVEEHGDAATVRLVMNGQTIATFTFATNSWVGEMDVDVGTETPHIDVQFLEEDGEVIAFDSDFYLEVDVEDESIAEFEQDTPGEFGGHLHGVAAGETDVTFSLMHGTVGSGHADFTTAAVHAHVH